MKNLKDIIWDLLEYMLIGLNDYGYPQARMKKHFQIDSPQPCMPTHKQQKS